jgi:hypothetical protein
MTSVLSGILLEDENVKDDRQNNTKQVYKQGFTLVRIRKLTCIKDLRAANKSVSQKGGVFV